MIETAAAALKAGQRIARANVTVAVLDVTQTVGTTSILLPSGWITADPAQVFYVAA